jgi:hypothetical protein
MTLKQKQINAAARKLSSMLETYLRKLEAEERGRRNKNAMRYAATFLIPRRSSAQ